MNKHRIFLLIGVLLVAFVLVGSALAAAGQARQMASLAGLPKSILNSPQSYQPVRTFQPNGQMPPRFDGQERILAPVHNYTPSLPARPAPDWQAAESGGSMDFTQGDPGGWDGWIVHSPFVISDSGTLYMWYSGANMDGNNAIGLATSNDGLTFTKSPGSPFLNGAEAYVIKVAPNDYRMYFANWGDNNIYVALSSDGMSWTPQPNPVLTPTYQPGDWDRNFVADPVVIFDGATYFMYYEGGNFDPALYQIGLATSNDGFTWTRVQVDPVLSPSPGEWDEQHVLDPMVILDGSDWKMWYRGMAADGSRAIGYATSTDGVTWTKYAGNPVLTANPGGWDNYGPSGPAVIYDGTAYHMWYYTNRQIGYAISADGMNWERPLDYPVLQPGPRLYFEVNYGHDWAYVSTTPNEPVTVTLTDNDGNLKGTIHGVANTWGDFNTNEWQWDTGWQDIQPFDKIYVQAVGLSDQVEPIGEMQGMLDVEADTVAGSLNAPWLDEAQMFCELWAPPKTNLDLGMVPGDGGTFVCDFAAEGVDLRPGMQVALVYFEPDGDKVINVVEAPWMRVNYAHDWAGGNYPAGHTFTVTLLDSDDNLKATAVTVSESGWGWGGDGFETRWEQWTPQEHDIQPGDKLIFESDDSFYDEVLVGDIQGSLDIELNLVSGPIYADWLSSYPTMTVECHPWGAPPGTNIRSSSAGPDGDPPYACDWNGEWDIQPGQDVAVMYIEPDTADRVINVLHEPAPNMAIYKWTEGNPWTTPGGPVVFNIWYINDGDGSAETFRITDTLPVSTTYLTDTSGVPVTMGDSWVAWEFGAINPGEWQHFQVVLLNEAMPGTTLENWVEISALFDFEDKNDHASAQAWVGEGNYNLYVNKHPNPGDPTPGETMIYNIDYGNQDAFTSGQITLTETLPAGTSLVDWYSMNGYLLWEQVSYVDNVLVLSAPALPGYWGDQLRLTLLVDAGLDYGVQLTNTVEITTPGDVDPWNNVHSNSDAWTSPPRPDARINKQIPWERIYPGGTLVYPINFFNDGNTTFDAVITDTIPAGMTFQDVHAWLHGVEFDFQPVYMDEQVIVWNYADLPPGEWVDFDLRLAIDPAFEPGTTATNCIEIDTGLSDGSPWNNTACVAYTIQDVGPNLRVTKSGWWNWEGQLHYSLMVQNTGSEPLDNVWLTDTYPLSTTFNGNSWWWGPWITMTSNLTDRQLVFWVDYMNPGDNAGIEIEVDLDGDIIGERGLTFTNLAQAPVEGDVYPADNTAEVTNFTGPDVFIEKWLSGGVPLPGEILTFTVEFGNLNNGPWTGDGSVGSHITDTLPEGMTFITATAPWNATQFWQPESQDNGVLRWGWGTMWANSIWRFDIVVQLAEDLQDGDVLSNFIEAYGDNPEDYDFDWTNNFSELDIVIDIPGEVFFLPPVYK
jgi:uncharacterized repeat protein (TIGR01451 family)